MNPHLLEILSGCDRNSEGCLEWPGELNSTGYSRIRFNGVLHFGYRLVYELANGPIPSQRHIHPKKKLLVMHSCDNRKCINPEHLKLGTQKENMQHAAKNGRLKRSLSLYASPKKGKIKVRVESI